MPKYIVEFRFRGSGKVIIEAADADAVENILVETEYTQLVEIAGLEALGAVKVTEVTPDTDIKYIRHLKETT